VVVIFDPEGILIDTSRCRYDSWAQMAREQGIAYDTALDAQLAGMEQEGRLSSILSRAHRMYSPAEQLALLTRQSDLFDEELARQGDQTLRYGAVQMLKALRSRQVRMGAVMTGGLPGRLMAFVSAQRYFHVISRKEGIEAQLEDVRKKLNAASADCLLVTVYPDSAKIAQAMGMQALLCGHAEEQEIILQQILTMVPLDTAVSH